MSAPAFAWGRNDGEERDHTPLGQVRMIVDLVHRAFEASKQLRSPTKLPNALLESANALATSLQRQEPDQLMDTMEQVWQLDEQLSNWLGALFTEAIDQVSGFSEQFSIATYEQLQVAPSEINRFIDSTLQTLPAMADNIASVSSSVSAEMWELMESVISSRLFIIAATIAITRPKQSVKMLLGAMLLIATTIWNYWLYKRQRRSEEQIEVLDERQTDAEERIARLEAIQEQSSPPSYEASQHTTKGGPGSNSSSSNTSSEDRDFLLHALRQLARLNLALRKELRSTRSNGGHRHQQ